MLRAVVAATHQACSTRGPRTSLGHSVIIQTARHDASQPYIGCSHWTGPFRPFREYSTKLDTEIINNDAEAAEEAGIDEELDGGKSLELEESKNFRFGEGYTGAVGITVDRVDPAKLNRPALPTSIKKLNRLLSHDRSIPIPASDLIERFVKGRGPGGQAINKTNSSVSLTHIPTGIRIQSQPTRSREENRKIARKILAEKLDLLRARETARLREPEPDSAANNEGHVENGGGLKKSRKEKEKEMAGVWSRDEIRWEKERRRKVNKAKKTKKKRRESAVGLGDEPTQEDQGANSSAPDR